MTASIRNDESENSGHNRNGIIWKQQKWPFTWQRNIYDIRKHSTPVEILRTVQKATSANIYKFDDNNKYVRSLLPHRWHRKWRNHDSNGIYELNAAENENRRAKESPADLYKFHRENKKWRPVTAANIRDIYNHVCRLNPLSLWSAILSISITIKPATTPNIHPPPIDERQRKRIGKKLE